MSKKKKRGEGRGREGREKKERRGEERKEEERRTWCTCDLSKRFRHWKKRNMCIKAVRKLSSNVHNNFHWPAESRAQKSQKYSRTKQGCGHLPSGSTSMFTASPLSQTMEWNISRGPDCFILGGHLSSLSKWLVTYLSRSVQTYTSDVPSAFKYQGRWIKSSLPTQKLHTFLKLTVYWELSLGWNWIYPFKIPSRYLA